MPKVADRCYRSPSSVVGGVTLLVVGGWLSFDAVLNGTGRTPAITLATLLCVVPLVVAYTLRPAVFAGRERLRVRNPLRTISVPWPSVESLQAAYTSEVIADGRKYQLWAIPVSLKARKSANRHNERVQSGRSPRGILGFGRQAGGTESVEKRAATDESMAELRELALRHGTDGVDAVTPGAVTVRWAYEILGPAVLGGIALAALLMTR
ncbi:hypothetical protein AN216_10355 [Streptomyces oceani]|uniref:Low molecular weight protein antigen 6 PH domain-containing protein n=1 Tax=Streptomyces oceani TaxID=1075402 RepID=A0A1E7KIK0_9ACTN|nr:hypothetical protein AN216_10355 [Streptomyces oceani]